MMRLECSQGGREWHWRRLGIPTASQFSRILTPKKREYADGAATYINELLAEWLIGMPVDGGASSGFMERGTALEPKAVSYYELQRDVDVDRVGFCLRDDLMVGASPDGLVGTDGGIEVKCPSAKVHVANLLDMKDAHFAQAQGGMWVTGRKWWDLISYHPELPTAIVRYERDDVFIGQLSAAMDKFLANLQVGRARLLELGCTPATTLNPEFAASLAA